MERPARNILRRVGFVLIVGGCVDIGIMIYAVTHGNSYRSSFNVFAVAAGIFLVRGNLKAASIVRSFAIFFLSTFLGIALALPFMMPPDLMLTEFLLMPSRFAMSLAVSIVLLALLFWVVRELGREPIKTAHSASEGKATRIKLYVAAGFLLPAGIVLALHYLLGGDRAHHAEQLAEQQLGAGYKFRTTSMRLSSNLNGTKVWATVTAWNHSNVRHVPEEWTEK